MIKKLILFLTFCAFSVAASAKQTDCSSKYSALVVAEKNNAILFEKRSDKISYPASLVKMMTIYLTFEALEKKHLSLEKTLTVSARGEEIAKVNNGNTLHLKEGDKIKVKEAIEAVLVKSFNEAAVTLAEGVSGDEWNFVRKMNQKAQDLGMINTSFRNASGLHEVGQYTTSYDLARLAIALRKNFPQYYHFFSMKKFSYHKEKYLSHNHVLLEYKGAEGMKTGFTNASGFNLVSAAKKKNERIFSIVLGCPTAKSRDELAKDLLDIGFNKLHENNGSKPLARLDINGFDYRDQVADLENKKENKVEKKIVFKEKILLGERVEVEEKVLPEKNSEKILVEEKAAPKTAPKFVIKKDVQETEQKTFKEVAKKEVKEKIKPKKAVKLKSKKEVKIKKAKKVKSKKVKAGDNKKRKK